MRLQDSPAIRPFLARLTVHSQLDERARSTIAALPAFPEQVRTNRDFVRLGEQCEYACLVFEGLVGCFGQDREGGRQITALHIPGDMADLHSVAVPQAGSALQALTVSTIFKVPHDSLREAARINPAIAEAFWRQCVIDAGVVSEWLVNVGRRDATSGLAHLLAEVACRSLRRVPEDGDVFPFAATQSHVADMLGLTPVHVNRTFQQLRRQQVIATDGRMVTILDWERLARIAGFDSDYLHLEQCEEVIPLRVYA